MDVPAGSVVVGVPGKVIKQTTDAQKEYILSKARAYVQLASEYAHG
jgi:carbonic anhydrase/acetyltransferase-like protein (isoleucine patch superfamily)